MKIYMFHYVKEYSNYYYFDKKRFEEIVKYFSKKYNVISLKDYRYIDKKSDNNIMFTFDDGTLDHYENVYPILKKYNCSGLFFITSSIITENPLDIQIIHKLLEKVSLDELYSELCNQIKYYDIDINKLFLKKTLDNNKMAFFKQMLQYILPEKVRKDILLLLTKKYEIDTDTNHIYIGIDKLKKMKKNGMYFGIHTVSHPRLSLLNYDKQKEEIYNNMNFLLKEKLIDNDLKCIAFPYGDYDNNTIKIMKELDINYGFKIDNIKSDYDFLIGRIDCNVLRENNYEKLY